MSLPSTPSSPLSRPPAPRVADVQLRGATGPVRARVHWPAPAPHRSPAIVVLYDRDALAAASHRADHRGGLGATLSGRLGCVVLSVSVAALPDAMAATEWAADHAAELGADPQRLIVAGEGAGAEVAFRVAAQAHANGWPPLARQVLIAPEAVPPSPPPDGSLAGAAPAIVAGGQSEGCARWLRAAGAEVEAAEVAEVRVPDAARVLDEIARALHPILDVASPWSTRSTSPPRTTS